MANGNQRNLPPQKSRPNMQCREFGSCAAVARMAGFRPAADFSCVAMIDQQPQVVSTTTFCLSGCRSTDYPCQHIPH